MAARLEGPQPTEGQGVAGLTDRPDRSRVLAHTEVRRVRAAGGVLFRPGPSRPREIVLVHRPGYDDWTLPKGKIGRLEEAEAAAVREVEEETGYRCEIVRPIGCTAYVDVRGRDKVVCYWLMRWLGGEFRPNREVDQLRWFTESEAIAWLSYPRDRALVEQLRSL